jgi:putative tryptophan/tyrosine transport system substrate-binding protein
MRRRDLLLLGTAAIAAPTVARPQTSGGIVPLIGFLGSAPAAAWQATALRPIRQGLSETGFTEGKNIIIEYRWADDHYDRLPALAVELAQKDTAVLVAPGTVAAAKAAMAATRTIPIVFMIASDPVEDGLVSSFNHPGGNVTGVGYLNAQVASKRLQLLHEAVPAAATITLLVNPANPVEADSQTKELQAAAALGLQLRVAEVTTGGGRARIYGGRERWQRRHSAERRSAVRPAAADGGNSRALRGTDRLSLARIRAGRRAHKLWLAHRRRVSQRRGVCRTYPQR